MTRHALPPPLAVMVQLSWMDLTAAYGLICRFRLNIAPGHILASFPGPQGPFSLARSVRDVI
ncbi:hypothetical protein ACVIM9_008511 [Bradyrhizobium sp. USDA 4520]